MTGQSWFLTLFGGLDLTGPNSAAAESVLVQPKHMALLAHLAVEPVVTRGRRYSRRDSLVGLLWPDLDQTHARTALRRVVHQIRGALGADVLLSRGDEDLSLTEEAVGSDARAFVEAIAHNHLARALEIYSGELMPGFHLSGCAEFERWLDIQREHFRREAGATAWALAKRLESDDELSMAGQVARRAVHYSWDDERMLRRAIEMLERLGDRSGGLRLYAEFSRRLRADFDATPAPETVALAERLRSG
jgi:DNA-binding SARP family transcriptional activator